MRTCSKALLQHLSRQSGGDVLVAVVPELAPAGESMAEGKGDGVNGSHGGKNARGKISQANKRKLVANRESSEPDSQKLQDGMDVVHLNAIGTAARVLHLTQSMQVTSGRVICTSPSLIQHRYLLEC